MKTDRKKSKKFVHIAQILDKTLGMYRREFNAELCRVWDMWDQIIGPMMAGTAHPAAFKGKKLLIHADDSTTLHYLTFMKDELVARINEVLEGNFVEEIEFKIRQ